MLKGWIYKKERHYLAAMSLWRGSVIYSNGISGCCTASGRSFCER